MKEYSAIDILKLTSFEDFIGKEFIKELITFSKIAHLYYQTGVIIKIERSVLEIDGIFCNFLEKDGTIGTFYITSSWPIALKLKIL